MGAALREVAESLSPPTLLTKARASQPVAAAKQGEQCGSKDAVAESSGHGQDGVSGGGVVSVSGASAQAMSTTPAKAKAKPKQPARVQKGRSPARAHPLLAPSSTPVERGSLAAVDASVSASCGGATGFSAGAKDVTMRRAWIAADAEATTDTAETLPTAGSCAGASPVAAAPLEKGVLAPDIPGEPLGSRSPGLSEPLASKDSQVPASATVAFALDLQRAHSKEQRALQTLKELDMLLGQLIQRRLEERALIDQRLEALGCS